MRRQLRRWKASVGTAQCRAGLLRAGQEETEDSEPSGEVAGVELGEVAGAFEGDLLRPAAPDEGAVGDVGVNRRDTGGGILSLATASPGIQDPLRS